MIHKFPLSFCFLEVKKLKILKSDWIVEIMLLLTLPIPLCDYFLGELSAIDMWIMISILFVAAYLLRSGQLYMHKKVQENSRKQ